MESFENNGETWYKTNEFWGCASAICAIVLPSLAYVMDNILWARFMLPLAWFSGLTACWFVVRNFRFRWRLTSISLSAILLGACLFTLYGAVVRKQTLQSPGFQAGEQLIKQPIPPTQDRLKGKTNGPGELPIKTRIEVAKVQPTSPIHKDGDDRSHQTGGSSVGPVTVQPGGVASFGQQGGQTAGTIINNGPPPLPIPNVSICVSSTAAGAQYSNVMKLNTDTEINDPWYVFFFDHPVSEGKASMQDQTFGFTAGRADKLAEPEKSVVLRFTNIGSFGVSHWVPGQEIVVTIPSHLEVRLIHILSGSGDVAREEKFKFPCGAGF